MVSFSFPHSGPVYKNSWLLDLNLVCKLQFKDENGDIDERADLKKSLEQSFSEFLKKELVAPHAASVALAAGLDRTLCDTVWLQGVLMAE